MGKCYSDLLKGAACFEKDLCGEQAELLKELSTGQAPTIALVTCSDSRIDPCLATQSGPGDLFVLRNAGNLVPSSEFGVSGESASLEFAVKGLQVEKIVVCGHSDCGAMKAVMNPASASSLKHIPQWVSASQGAMQQVESIEDSKEQLVALIKANVLAQLENLRTYDFVREAEDEGKLALHGWYFDIGKGGISEISANELV